MSVGLQKKDNVYKYWLYNKAKTVQFKVLKQMMMMIDARGHMKDQRSRYTEKGSVYVVIPSLVQ